MNEAKKILSDFKKENHEIIEILERKTLERKHYIKRKKEIDSDPNYQYDGKLIKERNDIISILEQCEIGIENIQKDLKKQTSLDIIISRIGRSLEKENKYYFNKELDQIKQIYDEANKQVLEIKKNLELKREKRNVDIKSFFKEELLILSKKLPISDRGISSVLHKDKILQIFEQSIRDIDLEYDLHPYWKR